ncbi:hypothetical protein PMIN07_009328 [Paraphaeosphaeria minitans]
MWCKERSPSVRLAGVPRYLYLAMVSRLIEINTQTSTLTGYCHWSLHRQAIAAGLYRVHRQAIATGLYTDKPLPLVSTEYTDKPLPLVSTPTSHCRWSLQSTPPSHCH